jgi:hypothetical protein
MAVRPAGGPAYPRESTGPGIVGHWIGPCYPLTHAFDLSFFKHGGARGDLAGGRV